MTFIGVNCLPSAQVFTGGGIKKKTNKTVKDQ